MARVRCCWCWGSVLVIGGCSVEASFEGVSPAEACDEIGFAIANKTMECSGDQELAEAKFDQFLSDYRCDVVPEDVDRTASDESYDDAFECVSTVLQLTCADTRMNGGEYHDWLRGSCVGAVSRRSGDGAASCETVMARVSELLDVCSALPAATKAYYLRAFEAQYDCASETSQGAYAACLEGLSCRALVTSWGDLTARIAACVPGMLRARERTGCELLLDAGPFYVEQACGVPADLSAPAYAAALSRTTCRQTATPHEVTQCIEGLGASMEQPGFDCAGLEQGGTAELWWQRLVERPQCCADVLDPCACFAGRVEELVFACTGREQLARDAGARAAEVGLCYPCELVFSACPAATAVDEWVTAVSVAIDAAPACEVSP